MLCYVMCYVERLDYWKQRISPGATSVMLCHVKCDVMLSVMLCYVMLCYVMLCVMSRERIIGSSVFHPGQQVTQSLQGGEAVQAATMIWDKL